MASCISLSLSLLLSLFFKEIHENFSRIVASGELFMIIWDGSDMQHCSGYQEILFWKCSKPTWELLIIQTPLRSAYTRPGLNIHFGSGKIWLALHELAKRLILYRCNMSVWVTAVGMGTKHEMVTAMPLYTACMRTKENSLTFTPSFPPSLPPSFFAPAAGMVGLKKTLWLTPLGEVVPLRIVRKGMKTRLHVNTIYIQSDISQPFQCLGTGNWWIVIFVKMHVKTWSLNMVYMCFLHTRIRLQL